MLEVSDSVLEVHKKAVQAMSNSYAPYSNLHVACGVQLKEPRVTQLGVNVENASYGGTICAERSAVLGAISQYGKECGFEFMVVISDFKGGPIPPCGLCLQVLKEFVSEDFLIYLGNEKAITKKNLFKEFLPYSFSSKMLPGLA